MTKALAVLATCLATAAPLQADVLDGADDPDFKSALTSLLADDDPAAVAALRDLAETGNAAALVTLPFALQWVPPKGNLKEKNAQRKVGGVNAQEAAAAADTATLLWDAGQLGDPMGLPDRAAGLLSLGEPEKAAFLLSLWLNQTGGGGDALAPLLADEMPAMLGAFALSWRLSGAVYADGPAMEEAARLLGHMREDRLAAWVAYVQLLDTAPEVFEIVGSPLAGTGLSAADTEARIEDARAVRAVTLMRGKGDNPVSAATAQRARDALIGRTELLPVTRLCEAHCPESLASCEAAVLAYPGQIFGGFETVQPFAAVLDPLDFAATDRGLFALVRPRNDPAAAADRATAEGLDACYASVLARRDTLAFGP